MPVTAASKNGDTPAKDLQGGDAGGGNKRPRSRSSRRPSTAGTSRASSSASASARRKGQGGELSFVLHGGRGKSPSASPGKKRLGGGGGGGGGGILAMMGKKGSEGGGGGANETGLSRFLKAAVKVSMKKR